MYAAAGGFYETVDLLLKAGGNERMNMTNVREESALWLAAMSGNQETARILLTAGAYIESLSAGKETPLLVAARRGHAHMVRFLLVNGADVYAVEENGSSALHLAARAADLDTVVPLVQAGCKLSAVNKRREGVLHYAALGGSPEIVELVLADKTVDVDQRAGHGESALHWGARGPSTKVMQLLLEAGADAMTRDDGNVSVMMHAISHGTVETARILLECWVPYFEKVFPDPPDEEQLAAAAPSHVVDEREQQRFDTEASKWLIQAVRREEKEFTEMLLAVGAIKRCAGRIMRIAAETGETNMMVRLLQSGLDLESAYASSGSQGGISETFLHDAARAGDAVMLRLLIDLGEDPNEPSESGMTPLHFAAREGHAEAVRMLIQDHEANIHFKTTPDLMTPLHLAAVGGHLLVVEALVNGGALIGETNQSGYTAEDLWPVASKEVWNELVTDLWVRVHGH
eukprot:TRINITY_DN49606_c0_g1_i1.p1 TRINITY_DN49606_c0_g1~~TRINITY_DN49606_c0_g1_i1.p1  ORF type:complete len:458 (-),score=138.45 TRINITY_DN49606_c0_g1_i1:186-1559(-)